MFQAPEKNKISSCVAGAHYSREHVEVGSNPPGSEAAESRRFNIINSPLGDGRYLFDHPTSDQSGARQNAQALNSVRQLPKFGPWPSFAYRGTGLYHKSGGWRRRGKAEQGNRDAVGKHDFKMAPTIKYYAAVAATLLLGCDFLGEVQARVVTTFAAKKSCNVREGTVSYYARVGPPRYNGTNRVSADPLLHMD